MDYIKHNKETYENAYCNGWGNKYVDSNWVSIFNRRVKPHIFQNQSVKVLDFGCSLGANSIFFRDLGYDVYGIDISSTAIKSCIERNNFSETHFKVANLFDDENLLPKLFSMKFDIIFASEVLYYFNDTDIKRLMDIFCENMKENGFFLANMITYEHPYYKDYKLKSEKRFVDVSNCSTITENLFVNILNDSNDMKELFGVFECKEIVTSVMNYENEKVENLYFIGKKR